MKLSFSTNAFVNCPVAQAVETIAAIGYEGVEIMADAPHLYAHDMTDGEIRKLKEVIDSTGIKVANINANTVRGYLIDPFAEPTLSHPDHSTRKWMVGYVMKCIDAALALGSRNVSITSGRIMPETTPEECIENLKNALRDIISHASRCGVRVGLEYEPGMLIEYSVELAALIGEMDSPWLGANLDLANSHILGEDPDEVLTTLSGRVFHVHLEDIKDRAHHHLIPGRGDMDFKSLFALHERHSYRGFFTVELYTCPDEPQDAAKKAFDYLKGASKN